jgi:hypothetical protein
MSNYIVVRFESNIKELVRKVAEARGEDVSDFVRRAVKTELARLSFLSGDEKKALGLEIKET